MFVLFSPGHGREFLRTVQRVVTCMPKPFRVEAGCFLSISRPGCQVRRVSGRIACVSRVWIFPMDKSFPLSTPRVGTLGQMLSTLEVSPMCGPTALRNHRDQASSRHGNRLRSCVGPGHLVALPGGSRRGTRRAHLACGLVLRASAEIADLENSFGRKTAPSTAVWAFEWNSVKACTGSPRPRREAILWGRPYSA